MRQSTCEVYLHRQAAFKSSGHATSATLAQRAQRGLIARALHEQVLAQLLQRGPANA